MSAIETSNWYIFGFSSTIVAVVFFITKSFYRLDFISNFFYNFLWNNEDKFATGDSTDFAAVDDKLLLISLQKQLIILRRIAGKMYFDRMLFMRNGKMEAPNLGARIFGELNSRQSTVQNVIKTTLEQRRSLCDRRFDKTYKTIDGAIGKFLDLKDQFQNVVKLLEEKAEQEKSPCDGAVGEEFGNKMTQTSDDEDLEDIDDVEELSNENLEIITTDIRECILVLSSESRNRGKDLLREIFTVIESDRRDIQKEISQMSAEISDTENSNLSLMAKMQKVEKDLLQASFLLNHQRLEVEAVSKMLTFFNRKFLYTTNKFDTYWQQSNVKYGHVARYLEDVKDGVASSAGKIEKNSVSVLQLSLKLHPILRELGILLENRKSLHHDKPSADQLLAITDSMRVIETLDNCCRRLDSLSEMLEEPRRKLGSLLQYSTEMLALYDLVKTSANGFDSLVSLLSAKNEDVDGVSPGKEESWVILEENKMKGDVPGISWQKEGQTHPGNQFQVRVRSGERLEINKIIKMLDDIMRATYRLTEVSDRQSETTTYQDTSSASGHFEHKKVAKEWEEIPSEVTLGDVSHECFVSSCSDSIITN